MMEETRKKIDAENLHDIIDDVLYSLREGTMEKSLAKEVINAAGKKIALVKVQLDYANMWGGKVEVPFLSTEIMPDERKRITK